MRGLVNQATLGMVGDIALGRPNLGPTTDVGAYRLMQFTLRNVLIRTFGAEAADRVFYEAGRTAGRHFGEGISARGGAFSEFAGELQEALRNLKMGILRVEKADLETRAFTITVAEDLDCSGLPVHGEEVCTYGEGFLAGLLEAYTGQEFTVKEVDCWCSGDRVCRFEARPAKGRMPA